MIPTVNGATTTLYYRVDAYPGSCPPVYSNTVEVLVPRPIARLRRRIDMPGAPLTSSLRCSQVRGRLLLY